MPCWPLLKFVATSTSSYPSVLICIIIIGTRPGVLMFILRSCMTSLVVTTYEICNLLVADFICKQDVKYTFFNHTRAVYTWIDHIITTSYDTSDVVACKIIPEEASNVSDHLPVRIVFKLKVCRYNAQRHYKPDFCKSVPVNWTNSAKREVYKDLLTEKLKKIGPPCFDKSCIINGRGVVDIYISKINFMLCTRPQKRLAVPLLKYFDQSPTGAQSWLIFVIAKNSGSMYGPRLVNLGMASSMNVIRV